MPSAWAQRHEAFLRDCSPTRVAAGERAAPSRAAWARVIKAGACMEARGKRGQGAGGMDEYQVRPWQGWHHPMA